MEFLKFGSFVCSCCFVREVEQRRLHITAPLLFLCSCFLCHYQSNPVQLQIYSLSYTDEQNIFSSLGLRSSKLNMGDTTNRSQCLIISASAAGHKYYIAIIATDGARPRQNYIICQNKFKVIL